MSSQSTNYEISEKKKAFLAHLKAQEIKNDEYNTIRFAQEEQQQQATSRLNTIVLSAIVLYVFMHNLLNYYSFV